MSERALKIVKHWKFFTDIQNIYFKEDNPKNVSGNCDVQDLQVRYKKIYKSKFRDWTELESSAILYIINHQIAVI